MFFLKVFVVLLTYLATCCNTQSYNSYRYPTAQRRAGYSYSPASYYTQPNSYYSNSSPTRQTISSSSSYYNNNKPKSYYTTSSGSSSSYPAKSNYPSSTSNRYTQQSSTNAVKGYSSPLRSQQYTTAQNSQSAVRGFSTSPYSSISQSSHDPKRGYSSSPYTNDYSHSTSNNYLTNSYNFNNKNTSGSRKVVNKADAENAKFAGVGNQENVEETGRTVLRLKKRKLLKQRLGVRYGYYGNPCFPYGRDAAGALGKSVTPPPKEQGRFLFDVNVYNVHPTTYGGFGSAGCGGGFGGGGFGGGFADPGLGGGLGLGGGGLLSDPVAPAPLYPEVSGLSSFLNFWAPGVLQAATARPPAYADYRPLPDNRPVPDQLQENDLQSEPDVDPNYRPAPFRRPPPNRVYYDSAGAAPITPAQLVGGVATTVNGIIQQLTGNVGVLQAAPARPQSYADYRPLPDNRPVQDQIQENDLQSDPEVDPNYRPAPVRRPPPNRVYYDSAGAAPVTPGQLVGGVASTVNGIIQQLTGNIQPVYG